MLWPARGQEVDEVQHHWHRVGRRRHALVQRLHHLVTHLGREGVGVPLLEEDVAEYAALPGMDEPREELEDLEAHLVGGSLQQHSEGVHQRLQGVRRVLVRSLARDVGLGQLRRHARRRQDSGRRRRPRHRQAGDEALAQIIQHRRVPLHVQVGDGFAVGPELLLGESCPGKLGEAGDSLKAYLEVLVAGVVAEGLVILVAERLVAGQVARLCKVREEADKVDAREHVLRQHRARGRARVVELRHVPPQVLRHVLRQRRVPGKVEGDGHDVPSSGAVVALLEAVEHGHEHVGGGRDALAEGAHDGVAHDLTLLQELLLLPLQLLVRPFRLLHHTRHKVCNVALGVDVVDGHHMREGAEAGHLLCEVLLVALVQLEGRSRGRDALGSARGRIAQEVQRQPLDARVLERRQV
mmetsp:Transcript_423/g.1467  ORF Transcript_423/g.1467 Transcript_423/m.1467 type:complete len:410 (-) Transcript_423:366-1595(-)